jgi:hypothetical protein
MLLTQTQLRSLVIDANGIFPGIFGTELLNDNEVFDRIYLEYRDRVNALKEQIDFLVKNKSCIMYLGIGEAPTSWRTTYFYSPVACSPTPWFDVPLRHFFPTHDYFINRAQATKISAIKDLTKSGYFLVDVSPLPFVGKINRGLVRFRKLIEYLYCNYFIPYFITTICKHLCSDAKTILIGTLSTDRIIYKIITSGIPCPQKCGAIILKAPALRPKYPRSGFSLSTSCATNGPVLNRFVEAAK